MPVLLAGVTGVGSQDHQSSMWAPRLEAAGFFPAGVWSPPEEGERADAARRLAQSLDVSLSTEPSPPAVEGAVIACLRGEARARLLSTVPAGTAVLVDKPTLDATDELAHQLSGTSAQLLSGLHLAAHPSFTRVASAVRDGEIGLLRAVMVDLVVARGDGASPEGDLRNIGVHAADLLQRLTGPASVTIATASLASDQVTLLGQTDRDVVLSAHVSRIADGDGTVLARLRAVGSHGHVSVDLTAPALTVRTAHGTRSAGYGADSVTARLRQLRAIADGRRAGETAESWLSTSRLLDAVGESARSGASVTVEKSN
ncbi:MAG: hypothetical protein J7484_04385 [Microbacterium sp.]|nr:hypothetical protein [Microbacterium sp.]